MDKDDKVLIWSIEHQAWWKPNQRGYCVPRSAAGIYTLGLALEICKGANIGDHDEPNEAIVPLYSLNIEPEKWTLACDADHGFYSHSPACYKIKES